MSRVDILKDMLNDIRVAGMDNIPKLTDIQRRVVGALLDGKNTTEAADVAGINRSGVWPHLYGVWVKSTRVVQEEK